VHRDLKADNILMHYGIVKIADFGFSKQLKEGNSITIVGTRPYTAPEIMKGERYGLKVNHLPM
jgi:serine/threonine protein kinase